MVEKEDLSEQLFCEKCKKMLRRDSFYKTRNLQKYPTGRLNQCRKCITMHIDNFNPDTYLWILQEIDVPYMPNEWNSILTKKANDRESLTGMSILGRYLSKMQIKQYKDYRWEDSNYLQEVQKAKAEQAMKTQGFTAAQIDKMINTGMMEIPENVEEPEFSPAAEQPNYFAETSGGGDDDFTSELTDEDKKYLRLKWGKAYKPEEWIKLEKLYEEMMQSYDVQGAGHVDTLKLVCKTSLKANQLIDLGDVEGFQKMSKVYDQLMKSGKFTAAQNKAEDSEVVDSVSELVAMCEKEGFIPRYYIDSPNDKVDATLKDFKSYTYNLVTEEMNLGNLIENAVKTMQREESKEEDEDVDDEELSYEELDSIKDEDFAEHHEFLEEEAETDEAYLRSLEGAD